MYLESDFVEEEKGDELGVRKEPRKICFGSFGSNSIKTDSMEEYNPTREEESLAIPTTEISGGLL